MPDEHSNLNLPAAARRPAVRRRGRRGGRGRGRGPRPATDKPLAAGEETPVVPESADEAAMHEAVADPERDTSGDFREPHPEEASEAMPAEELSHSHAETQAESAPEIPAEPVAEVQPALNPEPERERERERRQERPRHQEQRRPEPKPWVKPADFRPAETSAVNQAVAHATEIAESLKQMIDQLDEILELVEVAERQKLADEREIEELRRALRRIQPPRNQPPQQQRGPRHDDSHRGHREHGHRHDEGRHAPHQARQEPQEPVQRHEEPPQSHEADEPPPRID